MILALLLMISILSISLSLLISEAAFQTEERDARSMWMNNALMDGLRECIASMTGETFGIKRTRTRIVDGLP